MQRTTVFERLDRRGRARCAVALLAGCEQGARAEHDGRATRGGVRPARDPTAAGAIHDWPTGHYRVVENWPKPLPDTRHSHDGWTWGSFGGVYAESPDRIWVAMRGELPLPEGAAPWTPYAALNPSRGNSTGNGDGITATCEPEPKRGWERRWEHSIIIVDGEGNLVDEWPHLDPMFSQLPCGRGPHQIKISPYDPEKHVWIIDDQLHMIYRFTYDGQLEMQQGRARRARPRPEHVRPADRHRVAARRHVLHHRRLRRHARREVRRERQLHQGLGPGAGGSRESRARTSSTPCTASRSAPTSACSSSTAAISACRCSTRTAISSTCGRCARRTGPRARPRSCRITSSTTRASSGPATRHTNRILKFDLDGNFLYSWGAAGSAARTARLLARHHDGSARQSVPRRLLRGPRAEVRAVAGCGSRQDRRADLAHLGYLAAELTADAACKRGARTWPRSSARA